MVEPGPLTNGMASLKSSRTKKSSKDIKEKTKEKSKRDVGSENGGVPTAPSGAMSSFKALMYHDIPPEIIRRLAERYTVGHKKYGVGHVNLNWKTGLDDPEYIADRFNHFMEHLMCFLESQNEKDDNLGAMLWNLGFLVVAETKCPEAFELTFIQGKLFGESAAKAQQVIKEKSSVRS